MKNHPDFRFLSSRRNLLLATGSMAVAALSLCGATAASATSQKSSMAHLAEQFMNEERARSLNAFHQLLDAIEHKRMR